MLEMPALLVVLGLATGKAPTIAVHRFERSDLCEATASTLVARAEATNRIWRGQVVAFCIPAEPRR